MTLGHDVLRVDAAAKTTGEATYPADLCPPGALYGEIVFSDQPHARMVSMDTSAAEATPGVVLVLTAADVPVNEYGLTMFDQPVLVGVGANGRSDVPSDVSRWEADHVAVVVAETRQAAAAGAAALGIEWEPLPPLTTIDEALETDVLLHPENGLDTNDYHHIRIRKGDVAAGWAEADVTVEGTYELPYQEHAYLQPEAAFAYTDDDGRVTVVVAGQWIHEDQEQIAHALDLPPERVRVVYPAIGGAFGGREDMTMQIVLALAAVRLRERGDDRAVFAEWTREESIVGHHKRHCGVVRTRWGATADGRITVVEADCHLDAGGYNYTSNKVLGNLQQTVAGPYEVANARIDCHAVYTNNPPTGAFRGFGAPQGAFVAETQLNKLAALLALDPVELRRRNCYREGSVGISMALLPPAVSLPEVIDGCAEAARWDEPLPDRDVAVRPFVALGPTPSAVRRGRGFACAFKNIGFAYGFPERCEAEIVLHGDPGDDEPSAVDLFHGGADVGQGAHTAFLQMAAEAVGVPFARVRGHFSDTATTGDSGSASASRLTFMAGNAIAGAAEEAEKRWRDGDRPAVGKVRYTPRATEPYDPETGASDGNITFGYVAQAVDLSVDVETGHIVVHELVNCSDVGRAINPAMIHGQVHGAVVQAHGYAITENLRVAGGRIVNPRLSTYLIPGIGDVPEHVTSVLVEVPDPQGPWGARGMAEMPLIPYAPAVVAAVHDATGVWIDALPLTPDRVRAALRQADLP